MGAKNKQRRRRQSDKKVTFNPEDTDMEAGSSGGVENGGTKAGGGQAKPSDDGEEFSLDEVLKLGGTQVGPGPEDRDNSVLLIRSMSLRSSKVTWIMSSSLVMMTKNLPPFADYDMEIRLWS